VHRSVHQDCVSPFDLLACLPSKLLFHFEYEGLAGSGEVSSLTEAGAEVGAGSKHGAVESYARELSLRRALVAVEFAIGEVRYRREIFASAVDQVMGVVPTLHMIAVVLIFSNGARC
jgi:hypothetical protein